jgi:hypothetical protein
MRKDKQGVAEWKGEPSLSPSAESNPNESRERSERAAEDHPNGESSVHQHETKITERIGTNRAAKDEA